MAVSGIEGWALLLGRILFGVVVAAMGLNHFQQTDWLAGYAEAKGVPAPTAAVLGSGAVLVLGGLGIAAGVLPIVSGVAVAAFLVVSAVSIHDYWAADEEDRADEQSAFMKNLAMAGGAVTFAAVGTQTWALSAGVTLF
ncbi:MAG: DoxX family protein [Halobacteriaceae archaeon]